MLGILASVFLVLKAPSGRNLPAFRRDLRLRHQLTPRELAGCAHRLRVTDEILTLCREGVTSVAVNAFSLFYTLRIPSILNEIHETQPLGDWHPVCHLRERTTGEETMAAIQTMQLGSMPNFAETNHGESDALAAVVSRYSPALYKIALRKLGNVEDAEDAVQDALLSAFKNMHQFRGQAQLSTWLGTIVLNCARMQIRRRLNHGLVSLDQDHEDGTTVWAERLESATPDPEETLRRNQVSDTLHRAVEKLPRRLRSAFRLRVFEGLSSSEAADALGIREGTLKARFFRARTQVTARMRRSLKPARGKNHTNSFSLLNSCPEDRQAA
jgi:RNA polymerase sigma-70 factor, ECF subfamily